MVDGCPLLMGRVLLSENVRGRDSGPLLLSGLQPKGVFKMKTHQSDEYTIPNIESLNIYNK